MVSDLCGCFRSAEEPVVLQDPVGGIPPLGPGEQNSSKRTTTLRELLQETGQKLFDMTAYSHGESRDTTSHKKCPTLRKRTHGDAGLELDDDDDDTNPNKKIRAHGGNSEGGKEENHENETPGFSMRRWAPELFYEFLESGDTETLLQKELPTENEGLQRKVNHFKAVMHSSMMYDVVSEAMDNHVEMRYIPLSHILSSSVPENDTVYLGLKKKAKNLPANLGPHNQVDFIFSRSQQQSEHTKTAMIPYDNKVSWNFPGRSVTSQAQDYAVLGRDVRLDELDIGKEVSSFADGKKTEEKIDMLNPAEGEDAAMLAGMPGVHPQQAETNEAAKSELVGGKYMMKHDVFPVRQIVSCMLSYRSRFGILSTGYRFDFLELEVLNRGTTKEELAVFIAGPLWSVGGLNQAVLADRESQPNETNYYKFIHRYGSDDEATTVSILNEDEWSTNIGQYPFMEGLLRFLVAATSLVDETEERGDQRSDCEVRTSTSVASTTNAPPRTQHKRPRSHIPDSEMPSWWDDYRKSRERRQPRKKRNTKYEELCDGSEPFYFENDDKMNEYLSMMKTEYGCDWSRSTVPIDDHDVDSWKLGLTKFGPLTLAELESGEKEAIGFGRIGEAIQTKLHDLNVAFKLLRRSEWSDKEFNKRVEELKHEMRIYKILSEHQGKRIPRFLYAGSIVAALYWLIPEYGEMIALATTYEGESLSSYIESGRVGTLGLKCSVYDEAIDDIKSLHESGVVHRDLELRNLLYDKNQRKIKFIDFGNASYKDEYNSDSSFKEDCELDLRMLKSELSKLPFERKNEPPCGCAPTRCSDFKGQ